MASQDDQTSPTAAAEDSLSMQASAVEPTASTDVPTGSVAGATGSGATGSGGTGADADRSAAPIRKRAARRATKKVSAPSPVDATSDPDFGAPSSSQAPFAEESAPAADGAPLNAAAEKSVKKATKKAAKKATKRAAEEAAGGEHDAAASQPTDDAAETADQLGAEHAGRQGGAPTDVRQPEPPSTGAAPTFGLMFQAPDPVAAPVARKPARKKAEPKPVEDVVAEAELTAQRGQQDRRAQQAQPDEQDFEEDGEGGPRRRRRRGGKGRRGRGGDGEETSTDTEAGEDVEETSRTPRTHDSEAEPESRPDGGPRGNDARDASDEDSEGASSRRRTRRRRRSGSAAEGEDPPGTVTKVRVARKEREEPTALKGSTRLEAKKQRRREGREAGRRRTVITEAEFLARRESVERVMAVRTKDERTQIGVLEDGVLVEHYVSRESNVSMAGNIYLGRVQNVLPSMEAAFVDIGKGRNAVLYAGEVNWDAAGLENNQGRRIENALKSGDAVLVQVTKDPIGHKGARLTSQISLPGRYLVYVPEGSMTGISRKLPDTERTRLKAILKEVVPDSAGVIVRTAAEGASEEELRADVARLTKIWESIRAKAEAKSGKKGSSGTAPVLLHGEPDLTVRVIRDIFNEDFASLVVAGDTAWNEVSDYITEVAPDLAGRLTRWSQNEDLFTHYRIDEQIAKAMDRKVWLPSGGSLVIDRTEAMTVIDVNTGKFVGSGGNLEETVTKNNIEAAEEIVRQLRLRDIGGILVIDFIDMVLESNRDLVVRRLLECLGRDRTKHQVAEVTSLGLVQMTRKRVGSGLIEVFSETCEHCNGRGIIVHADPVDKPVEQQGGSGGKQSGSRSQNRRGGRSQPPETEELEGPDTTPGGPTPAQIAAAAHAAAIKRMTGEPVEDDVAELAAVHSPEHPAEPGPAGLDHASPVTTVPTATFAPAIPEPAPRTRRKRGRVVAPAGPPRPREDALE